MYTQKEIFIKYIVRAIGSFLFSISLFGCLFGDIKYLHDNDWKAKMSSGDGVRTSLDSDELVSAYLTTRILYCYGSLRDRHFLDNVLNDEVFFKHTVWAVV